MLQHVSCTDMDTISCILRVKTLNKNIKVGIC